VIKYHRNHLAGILEREKEMETKKMGLPGGKVSVIEQLRQESAADPRVMGFATAPNSIQPPILIDAEGQSDVSWPNRNGSENFCYGFRNGCRVQEIAGGTLRAFRAGPGGRGASTKSPVGASTDNAIWNFWPNGAWFARLC
jgi:hypothetical protein